MLGTIMGTREGVEFTTTKGAERKPEFLKMIMAEGVVLYGAT